MSTNGYRAPEMEWEWEGAPPPIGTEYEMDIRRFALEKGGEYWERQRWRVVGHRPVRGGALASIVVVSARSLLRKPCDRCHGHGVLVREAEV